MQKLISKPYMCKSDVQSISIKFNIKELEILCMILITVFRGLKFCEQKYKVDEGMINQT